MGNYVLDLDFCFDQQWKDIVPLATYDATTDTVIQIIGLNQKAVMIKNTGGAALTYSIIASLDRGIEYDLTERADTVVNSAAQDIYRFTEYYTHIKIRLKSAGSTTATIKAAGQSV